MYVSKLTLPIIITSQFLCTSLWFAGNSVTDELILTYQLNDNVLSYITSSVQFGFILGTLSFAFLSITDRFSPSKIFFTCAVLGSVFNLGILLDINTLMTLLSFRFLTGFCLAGIYPVGMKIASDYFDKGLGKSLGWLVGALVLGTAFPHFIKLVSASYSWEYVIIATSILAFLGGLMVVSFVPNGPFYKVNLKPNIKDVFTVFSNSKFRQAAIGYFGHMWELYAFWTFTPIMILLYNEYHPGSNLSVPLYSFIVISAGGLSCILGGYFSEVFGVKKTATYFLTASLICCVLSPYIFEINSILFVGFLIIWGMVVIADSPLFSTLVATNTEATTKGTALTIVNCIGFAITIISIETLNYLYYQTDSNFIFWVLAIGPAIGIRNLLIKHH